MSDPRWAFMKLLPRAAKIGDAYRYRLSEYALHVMARSHRHDVIHSLIEQAENSMHAVDLIDTYLHTGKIPAEEKADGQPGCKVIEFPSR